MSDFEKDYTRDKYERWEWDNTRIIYANDESRTRILYIGDSISWGIRDVATPRCEEKIIFDSFATSSRVFEVCNLWNGGIRSTIEIAKMMKIGRSTAFKYIRKGEELGIVQDPPKHIKRN